MTVDTDCSQTKRVFISYSHRDMDARRFISNNLVAQGVEVDVDEESLEAGEGLSSSLRVLISQSDFTVCLVSKSSLQSTWVMWEIHQALAQDGDVGGSKLLPCFLDDSFQDPNVIDAIGENIAEEIKRINLLREKAIAENMADDHLSDRRNSLIRFQNDLPQLVAKLSAMNVVDLTSANFDSGFRQLYKKITGRDELTVSLMDVNDVAHGDYQSRMDIIFDEINNNHTKEAAKKAMDLVREFLSGAKALLRKLGLLCASIVRLEEAFNEGRIAFDEYDKRLQQSAMEIMDLLPESPALTGF
ncbi:toll/interleukin-1 receptor domain-containing protein [Teredinibacter franksiae]|uniref:toll/interleukin-1 receptor domain-containing protein n=1 Tax=Teredinibacter franksiae TaxID=2761453 RepID=UPI0016231CE2|nr:toll/interleukin-1 receptor domain-containing protein [Teredinibacter franksiae]